MARLHAMAGVQPALRKVDGRANLEFPGGAGMPTAPRWQRWALYRYRALRI